MLKEPVEELVDLWVPKIRVHLARVPYAGGDSFCHHRERRDIQRHGWSFGEAQEFATLEWVDWFNNRRLLSPLAMFPRWSMKRRTFGVSTPQLCRLDSCNEVSGKPGTVQSFYNSLGDRPPWCAILFTRARCSSVTPVTAYGFYNIPRSLDGLVTPH